MSEPGDHDETARTESLLGRANALLKRRRAGLKPGAEAHAIPTLSDPLAGELDLSAVPTLTDIVADPATDGISGQVEAPAQSGQIISRVQAQNLDHGVYQKLKQGLDAQIAEVLQNRFMPDVAGALDQALHKISADLKSNINAMVRASIEETLQKQLQQLRPPVETADSAPSNAPEASGIIRDFSAPPQPGMELAKSFEPRAIEDRWYSEWESHGYFKQSDDTSRPAYCIQLPPPNVTGTLHMGHAFQQTLMDALIRYHRMRGYNTNWVVGTDHAGIATQIVVERRLEAEGKSRHDLGRDAFIQRVWEWKQHSGSTITRQMRRLGTSANWQYADTDGNNSGYFTMDAKMSRAVVEVFVRLHEEGLIYRGKRLVNWDPVLGTAVSDLEVDGEETVGKMWQILYPFVDGPQPSTDKEGQPIKLRGMTIATTRPETMLADGAVAVHPEDPRYRHLIGKRVILPLCERNIPVVADEMVDRDFGTGCVKITGAHDFNDYGAALRHNLPLIVIFTLDAKVNENGPKQFQGMDRYEARKAVVAQLERDGFLVKAE